MIGGIVSDSSVTLFVLCISLSWASWDESFPNPILPAALMKRCSGGQTLDGWESECDLSISVVVSKCCMIVLYVTAWKWRSKSSLEHEGQDATFILLSSFEVILWLGTWLSFVEAGNSTSVSIFNGSETEPCNEEFDSSLERIDVLSRDILSSRTESLHNIQILPLPSTLKLTTILATPRNSLSTSLRPFETVSSCTTLEMWFEISVQILWMRPASTVPLSGSDTLWISGPSKVIARSKSAKRVSCKPCLVLLRSCRQSFGVHMARIWELWRPPWGFMNRWRMPLLFVLLQDCRKSSGIGDAQREGRGVRVSNACRKSSWRVCIEYV